MKMENYKNDGFESHSEDRRDYGSDNYSNKSYASGYSQAGRKLRHRKNYTGGTENASGYQENRRNSFSQKTGIDTGHPKGGAMAIRKEEAMAADRTEKTREATGTEIPVRGTSEREVSEKDPKETATVTDVRSREGATVTA